MSERTEVVVDSLRVSLTSQYRIILLKDKNGPLSLPLFVGQFEAESIVLALQEIEISRPQTHDLILSAVKTLSGRILCAEITEMKASTYYAELTLQDAAGGILHMDCRPSDAIAIALRAHVPIYVSTQTLTDCGIRPEPDIRMSKSSRENEHEGEDDLSAFTDFLNNF